MKKRKKKKKEDGQNVPSLPLTPMIDCTFLLLIFFMLACRFRSEEGKMLAHLRDGMTGPSAPDTDLSRVRIKLLWYSPDGRARYTKSDGKLVVKIGRVGIATVFDWGPDEKGNMQPDWAAVRDYIEKKRVAYRPPAMDPARKLSVIIDARKYVPFYWVVRTLDTTLAAGVSNIQFAAPENAY